MARGPASSKSGYRCSKVDLEAIVAAQRDMEAEATTVPVRVRSSLLQGIKAANVFNDGWIELEFRG